MTVKLGANIASLRGQRQLVKTGDSLAQVYERLASGQRINRASDDAAGLAIADSLKSDARVYAKAIRNITDGASMLNIMDSALSSQSEILTRLRELAEQSANGVYSNQQREALNIEYQALVKEFGRIGDSTEYNDIKLLSSDAAGNTRTLSFQVGIDSRSSSNISFETQNTGSYSGTLNANGDYVVDGFVDGADAGEIIGADGNVSPEIFFERFGQNYSEFNVVDSSGETRALFGLVLLSGFGSPPTDDPGEFGLYYEGDDGNIHLAGSQSLTSSGLDGDVALNFTEFGTTGSLSFDINNVNIRPSAKYGAEEESAIDFTGVGTRERALHALEVTERRSAEIARVQGQVGSVQSRLSAALSLATVSRETFLAAESTIRSTDVSADAASLAKTTILQQVASAVLAQANQQPALALQLLS